MADGGPVDAGERGTSPADRGTSATPQRNAAAPDAGVPLAPSAASAKKRAAAIPQLAEDFAANLDKRKTAYAEAERDSYSKLAEDAAPGIAASARKAATELYNKIVKDLAGLTGEAVIASATELANQWIDATLSSFADPTAMKSDCVRAAFKQHFAAEKDADIAIAKKEIVAMLTELRDDPLGINSSAVTYECGGWCFGNPAMTGQAWASSSTLCNALWPYVFEEYRSTPRGYDSLAIVLLHEGLHRTSYVRFKHPLGETYRDTEQYQALSLAGHIVEADSYAYFAKDVAACGGS